MSSRVKIGAVHRINLAAETLVSALMAISETEPVCLLDSCGVSHLGSHLLIAGIRPTRGTEISNEDPASSLAFLDQKLSGTLAAIFTLGYDFGMKLEKVERRTKEVDSFPEPDIFLAEFDCLVIHDYDTDETFLIGDTGRFTEIEALLVSHSTTGGPRSPIGSTAVSSNFTKGDYLQAVSAIQELIRRGDTYQTNLTQRIEVVLRENHSPQQVFGELRRANPSPFAAFLRRRDSTVISASPERFVTVEAGVLRTSPIKGTSRRGNTVAEDNALKAELLGSEKDIAENTMIVDLLRNDLGRVCQFGSVEVEKLCDLQTHPTLFHLVSTVRGRLRDGVPISDIFQAVFPCGSITGAPKHRTMQIIDRLETADRGLSMGAIGYYIPNSNFQIPDTIIDTAVAIRTMVIHGQKAVFNVGGGIVSDSDPEKEYEESLLKAKALLDALGARFGASMPAR